MYDASMTTWLNPNYEYLFDSDIVEYDMHDAGFSLIKQYNLLPRETIIMLSGIQDKKFRHIKIGLLQKEDKEFSKKLNEKFAEMRKLFIYANNITDGDIISVKKDAFFTTKNCKNTTLGSVVFNKKNVYSSYMRFRTIDNLEIYYSDECIDIKGMSDVCVNRHRLYMLEFIRSIFMLVERKDASIKRKLRAFIDDYKFGNLDDEFYLEFNNRSMNLDKIFNYRNLLVPITQIVLKEVKYIG